MLLVLSDVAGMWMLSMVLKKVRDFRVQCVRTWLRVRKIVGLKRLCLAS